MSGRNRRGRPPHADVLTPTEWRVVHAVQHGLGNRAIAARRGISTDAVKFHVSNALAKLGLADRQALRRWFREPGTSALKGKERYFEGIALEAASLEGTSLAGLAPFAGFAAPAVAFFAGCGGFLSRSSSGENIALYL